MGIIEDAYQFGQEKAIAKARGHGITGISESLLRGQDIAASLVPQFFTEYREYSYTKSNADVVFQAIYFGIVDKIADQLKYNIKSEFTKFRAQIFASGMFSEFTGEKTPIRRTVEAKGTPLQKLMQNYTISTGRKPDAYAISQLEYIVNLGDRIARQHGATKDNINWTDFNLYLQPGMERISPEHILEIKENLEELFTEPTVKEMLKDAKAIFNDHKYNLVLAWYGGSQITAFYKDKEIGIVTLGSTPTSAEQAEYVMSQMPKVDEEYPEYFASDEKTFNELVRIKEHRG